MKEDVLRRQKAQKSENGATISARREVAEQRVIGKCPACGGKMKADGTGGFVCPYCDTRTAPAAAPAAGVGQAVQSAEIEVQGSAMEQRAEQKATGVVQAEQRAAMEQRAEQRAAGAGQAVQAEPAAERAAKRADFRKKYFSASTVAKLAMLSALAFSVTFLEFPIFPPAPFLKLDFANVFVLIGGFMYGPAAAVVISGVKECLCLLKSSTGGIGELANFIVTFFFVIVPTLVYRYKKGFGTVVITLLAAIVMQIAAGLLTNRFINFPLYMGEGALAAFRSLWVWVLLFNLIKGAAVAAAALLLYKKISWLLNKF